MHLFLKREATVNQATPGKLHIDGEFICYTLEDVVRLQDIKVYGQTAIPAGEYLIWLRQSPHFGRVLPTLMNVPMFSDILIHRGNKSSDTNGCILVGFKREGDTIWESEKAETYLMKELTDASKRSVLAITIENADPI